MTGVPPSSLLQPLLGAVSNVDGFTPMHYASTVRTAATLIVLGAGGGWDAPRSILYGPIKYQRHDVLQFLLLRCTDPNPEIFERHVNTQRLLYEIICVVKDIAFLRLLLPFLTTAQLVMGAAGNLRTSVVAAARDNRVEMLRVLLEEAPGVTVVQGVTDYDCPLRFMASHNNIEGVRLLLKHGADPLHRTRGGRNVLQYVEFLGKKDALKVLKAHVEAKKHPTALPMPSDSAPPADSPPAAAS